MVCEGDFLLLQYLVLFSGLGGIEALSFVGGSFYGSRVCGFVNFTRPLAWWVGEFLGSVWLKSCWVTDKRGISSVTAPQSNNDSLIIASIVSSSIFFFLVKEME